VKGYRYEVQPGDHVTAIAGCFGMPASRWPELVGANPGKPRCDVGRRYRCFSSLQAGEQLLIPAHWREPRSSFLGLGQPPAPSVDMMNLLRDAMVAASNLPGFWPLPATPPTQQNVDPISQIIASWWPYLQKLPGHGNVPGQFPTSYPELFQYISTNVITVENWGYLIRAANSFLSAMGYGPGTGKAPPPNILQIPWDTVPWAEIAKSFGSFVKQLGDIFAAKTPSLPPSVSPPAELPPSDLPDFFNPAAWTSGSTMHKVAQSPGFPETNWNEFLILVMQDPRYAGCIQNKARLEKLVTCQHCYSTPKQFVDLLCASTPKDPCDCKPDGLADPLVVAGGCEALLKEWSEKCGDLEEQTPECKSMMSLWTGRCSTDPSLPPPGTDPVGPVPGTTPPVPGTEPVSVEKKDNTFTYAAVGVGIALVGGLLVVISSGDK